MRNNILSNSDLVASNLATSLLHTLYRDPLLAGCSATHQNLNAHKTHRQRPQSPVAMASQPRAGAASAQPGPESPVQNPSPPPASAEPSRLRPRAPAAAESSPPDSSEGTERTTIAAGIQKLFHPFNTHQQACQMIAAHLDQLVKTHRGPLQKALSSVAQKFVAHIQQTVAPGLSQGNAAAKTSPWSQNNTVSPSETIPARQNAATGPAQSRGVQKLRTLLKPAADHRLLLRAPKSRRKLARPCCTPSATGSLRP